MSGHAEYAPTFIKSLNFIIYLKTINYEKFITYCSTCHCRCNELKCQDKYSHPYC